LVVETEYTPIFHLVSLYKTP